MPKQREIFYGQKLKSYCHELDIHLISIALKLCCCDVSSFWTGTVHTLKDQSGL